MTVDVHTCSPGRLFAAALRGGAVDLVEGTASRPLAVLRWNTTDASDHAVIAACEGATLDVGCGPGRMTSVLTESGYVALGIDVVPEAVRQTRERGGQALLRDIFDDIPGQGRWDTILLADGNIGIGGDPGRLLGRVEEVLAPGGRVVVDVVAPGRVGTVRTHQLSGEGLLSDPFPWAIVGADEVGDLGASVGLTLSRTEEYDGRWFAVLTKPAS
ncbi:methyltransferase type 12 [Marmoricola endophyticus]|uniref:Methyltransferase type 12 n=1 Tax=Marmoricola endophyticus TaxID=2040280 RepID=A0A917B927_9ACTN|nr:class I SAM-dependent methyltransferase [Marmoricola endophyticus]GGF30722.1 methyltransferase type 12 [Marmoricola endophyticus]